MLHVYMWRVGQGVICYKMWIMGVYISVSVYIYKYMCAM